MKQHNKKIILIGIIVAILALNLIFFFRGFFPGSGESRNWLKSAVPEFPTEHEIPDHGSGLGFDQVFGYIDKKGNLAIEPEYTMVFPFKHGLAGVWTKEDRLFINRNGSVALSYLGVVNSLTKDPNDREWSKRFIARGVYFFLTISEGMVSFPLSGKWGFVDTLGNVKIKPMYDRVQDFQEGLALVYLNGKYGFIDTKGTLAIPCTFNEASGFSEGMAGIMIDCKWGFIDRSGSIVINPQFDQDIDNVSLMRVPLYTFNQKRCTVLKHGIFMRIEPKGTVIDTLTDPRKIFGTYDGLRPFYEKGLAGFKNSSDSVVIKPRFSVTAAFFSEGLCYASLPPVVLFGYIDTTGRFVIPPRFTIPGDFSEGCAVVGVGSLEQISRKIIDTKGNTVSGHKWLRSASSIFPFSEGLAAVGICDKVWDRIKDKAPRAAQ